MINIKKIISAVLFAAVMVGNLAFSDETAEPNRPRGIIKDPKIKIEYVLYRKASWESQKVVERRNERPNKGGLIFVYFSNISNEDVGLGNWRLNGKDKGYHLQAGDVAWERTVQESLKPGQIGVVEICGVTEDYAEWKNFDFAMRGNNWRGLGSIKTQLKEDTLAISYIRVLPEMKSVDVYIRNAADKDVEIKRVELVGITNCANQTATWVSKKAAGKGITIWRVGHDGQLKPGDNLIAKVVVADGNDERAIYAHRRAFEDKFPIGTWAVDSDEYAQARQMHIDTMVRGGPADDPAFADGAKNGFNFMVHTGLIPNVDLMRAHADNKNVLCWLIHDEPDSERTSQEMVTITEITKKYDSTKPTFITLCRNVKFTEYAFLPDIPCMDHYCVTAPTTSAWPKKYGTRLEETAYYTRDLKSASEPKPVWVWTQGIADWDQRPKRPVPTPDELGAQLLLNIGRGAKGILWFTISKDLRPKYPELQKAIQGWGRVLEVMRGDLLGSEPIDAKVNAPEKIDVAVLAGWDKMIIVVTNLDYEIDDQAYPWKTAKDVKISFEMPSWINAKAMSAVEPNGIESVKFDVKDRQLEFTIANLEMGKIFAVFNSQETQTGYGSKYEEIVNAESK